MIFAKTYKLVLSGRKTQTLRLAYCGDNLSKRDGNHAVQDYSGRPRWIVGHIYAVQPERCHRAVCRIRITSLARVENPLEIDLPFAVAEGFDTVEEFLKVWHELHGKNPIQPCWVIGFELCLKLRAAHQIQNLQPGIKEGAIQHATK